MSKSNQKLLLSLLYVLVIISMMPIESHCAKKPVGVARKEDIPFIKCQVCEKLASQLHKQVQAKQAEITSKKISEYQIIEIAENVCNLKKQEANWILKIDIVEEGDKLKLVEQDSEGQCNSECKTIERACQEVLGYSDTDAAEYLYKKKPQLNSFVDFVCKDLTEACSSKPPPVPTDRSPGEPFEPKSAKEAEMEKLMKSMEGMPGAPGMKMYSREDLMNQKFDDEVEDDDEDDETNLPSKLGKVLREKDGKKYDWKERITKGVVDVRKKLKVHSNRVSNRLRQWWKSKKGVVDVQQKLKVHINRVSNRLRKWWKSKKTKWGKSSKSTKAEL